MSEKKNSKHNATLSVFIILLVTGGVPFQNFSGLSISLPTEVSFESDLKIINLLLGNGNVGRSIFEPSTYTTLSFDIENKFSAEQDFETSTYTNQKAYGQIFSNYTTGEQPEDPINDVEVGRGESTETIQIGDRKFITQTVPKWIENNEGEYVERIVHDDVGGVMFESAKASYYYSKEHCAMTVYDSGRISDDTIYIQKYNGWVVKSAENGTDTWVVLPQNNLDCEVSLINNDQETKIISTKSDQNGIFTEIYTIEKPLSEMETILAFWNNNTALNNHKIAFTNVLNDVPTNFRFAEDHQIVNPAGNYTAGELTGTNGTYFNAQTLQMENYTITDYSYPETYIDTYKIKQYTTNIPNIPDQYDKPNVTYIENVWNIPYTQLYLETGSTNGFTMDYWSDDKQRIVPLKYDFIGDSIDKLWNVKITRVSGVTNVYIDYMKIDSITPVGSTAILDPSQETNLGSTYVIDSSVLGISVDDNGVNGCKQLAANLAFTNDFKWEHVTSGGTFPSQVEYNGCTVPINQVNISSIPDLASVQQLDFGINATTNTCSASHSGCNTQTTYRWGMGNAEQILSLTGTTAGATVYTFDGSAENISYIIPDPELINYQSTYPLEPDGTGTFGCSTASCRFEISSQIDPTTATDLFETFLESGKDYVIWSGCLGEGFGTNNGCGYGVNAGGNNPAYFKTRTIIFDQDTFDLKITWEIFSLASAPTTLTCQSTSPTNLFLDWEAPVNSGGTAITGYKIERSSGGAYQTIQSNIPAVPTSYNDNTAFAGVTFTYRVSANNDVGTGAFAEISCGVAGVSGSPIITSLTNINLSTVAVDWTAPVFTGNTVITGYKVERTEGTPDSTSGWQFIQHKREGSDTNTLGNGVTILNVGDNVGYYRIQGVADTTVEGVLLSTHADGQSGIGHAYLFKDFAVDDLKNRVIEYRWDQFKSPAGFSLQVFGDWETRSFIVDGVYDMTGANVVGGAGSFPAQVAGTWQSIIHVPSVGNGIIRDCFDNATVLLGGTPSNTVLPATSQMEATGSNRLTCTTGTLTGGSQERATVVFMLYDNQVGLNGCGSNCASSGAGAVVIDYIDIDGLGTWDFQNDLPQNTLFTYNSPSVSSPLPMKNVVGSMNVQDFIIGDGFVALVNNTGNTNTEYLDNTVAENTLYGYRVFAWNSQGISLPSNTEVIETAGAPSAPVITATATGTQTINIDWTEPNLNGGTLVEYEIERKTTQAGIFAFLDTTPDDEHDDGTGLFTLLPATEYCYRVKTVTNVGSSSFSTEDCATTFDAPSVVQNMIVNAVDGSSVNLQFNTPANDGGSPITGYKVERKIGAGSFVVVSPLTFVQTRNDTGLAIGTLHTYRVSASNEFGFGATTQASDTTDATPQVPQNFSCSANSPDSISLTWTTPQSFSPPTGYRIDRNINGGAFSTLVANTASTATTYTNTPLLQDTIYGYKILAHTAEGDTLFTGSEFCKVLSDPDFPPENFIGEFSQLVPHGMTLTWDIPELFGIPITSIEVERDDGAGYETLATLPSNAVGMVDSDPDNDIDQKYRIKLVSSTGDSSYNIAIPSTTNQTSHWHYEKTPNDTGENKNIGTLTGTANYDYSIHNGLGLRFDGATRITVADETDYDFDNVSFGITTYYKGNSTGATQALVSKATSFGSQGYELFIDSTGVVGMRLTNTATTNEVMVLGTTNVTDNTPHFIGMGYNGNKTASGISLMVDGAFEVKNVITNNLVGSILNNQQLVLGGFAGGTGLLTGILDETRLFGSGTLDDDQMEDVFNEQIETIAPINATMTLTGSTFANISREEPIITLISGYPIPTITGNLLLKNFTTTTVNTASGLVIPNNGILNIPALFNQMGSLSNYTTIATLDNGLEAFVVISNADLQNPIFNLPEGIEFFFQHERFNSFEDLSFNFTKTTIPFDLACNLKSELFEDGETFEYENVGFLQEIYDVPRFKDVVVACIDQNSPLLNLDEPSFGGSNALLTFVSFGDTTGIGAFLTFTDNYGDFFGAPLPYLFIILLAALFTGRSAPTGIIIIGIALGIMWYMGLLTIDPIMWGIIVVLVILGAIGGKKFL